MDSSNLYDPVSGRQPHLWFPLNAATLELHAVIHACKQVVKLKAALHTEDPMNDLHGLALLATPVLTLVEHTLKLRKLTGAADRSFWPAADRERFRTSGKRLDGFSQGALRVLRRTLSAHADTKMMTEELPKPSAEMLVPPLGTALTVALLALNHNGVFEWTRTESASRQIVGQVSTAEGESPPVAVQIGTAADGTATLEALVVVDDPRTSAQELLFEGVAVYNAFAEACVPRQPAITMNEYDPRSR